MSFNVDNAIILAAGFSSRFAPLCAEKPKSLISVRGEVLIERQIRQLHEAGVKSVIVVTGYKKEMLQYLQDKLGVILVENPEYSQRNNHSSIRAAARYLGNSYICSSDNYFEINPFEKQVEEPYYAAVYAAGETREWCLTTDKNDWITNVEVGGRDQWYMLGHVFWDADFSRTFLAILDECYDAPETKDMLWESIYAANLDRLKLKIRRYPQNAIREFDTLDELRDFDGSYRNNTGSRLMESLAGRFNCPQEAITGCRPWRVESGLPEGFLFEYAGNTYSCRYVDGWLEKHAGMKQGGNEDGQRENRKNSWTSVW